MFDATFYAFVALVLFFVLLAAVKVPALVGRALDDRAARIAEELGEAERLRKEAEALLADYVRRADEAEAEALRIVADAKREAERLTAETETALSEMIARRTAAAEAKIAQAESQTVNEIRALAIDVAIAASARILGERAAGDLGPALIAKSIEDVRAKLN
jgi:F-type H+-transporting ATPase subunit b